MAAIIAAVDVEIREIGIVIASVEGYRKFGSVRCCRAARRSIGVIA